tara:strand:+ start:298 stop:543 length:246 start_codon:yes stop_codon:yes gene_type:complete
MDEYEQGRELATLKAHVNQLLHEKRADDETKKELFKRIGDLEKKVAQALALVMVIAIIVPVGIEAIIGHNQANMNPSHTRR